MTFTCSLLVVAILIAALYVSASRKKSHLAEITWDQMIEQLLPLPMQGVELVATDYLHPSRGQLGIETDEMWSLVGREEGLRRMKANAEVLIQLAALAQQWNLAESVIVGERMRREGLALRRAVRKVQLGLICGYGKAAGPFCVQEAVSAYYLMSQRLLALYKTSHAGRYSTLARALA